MVVDEHLDWVFCSPIINGSFQNTEYLYEQDIFWVIGNKIILYELTSLGVLAGMVHYVDYSYGHITATPAVLLSVTWVFVLLRCWVKARIAHSFGLDDWLLLLSLMAFTALCIIIIVMSHLGFGKHYTEITDMDAAEECIKLWLIESIIYLVASVSLRLSVATLLLRLAMARIHRYIIHFMTALNISSAIVCFFIALFECYPIQSIWDVNATGELCTTRDRSVAAGYLNAVTSAVIDCTFALLPIWMIWYVQMSRRTKVSIALVLGMGLASGLMNIVRAVHVNSFYDTEDPLWSLFPYAFWSLLETGIGILAASMATFRPLSRSVRHFIKKHIIRRFLTKSQPSRKSSRAAICASNTNSNCTSDESAMEAKFENTNGNMNAAANENGSGDMDGHLMVPLRPQLTHRHLSEAIMGTSTLELKLTASREGRDQEIARCFRGEREKRGQKTTDANTDANLDLEASLSPDEHNHGAKAGVSHNNE